MRKKRKVVIIGGRAEGKWLLAPYPSHQWEFWCLNAMRAVEPPGGWTRAFNLHRYQHMLRDWRAGLNTELTWAQAHARIPFYTLDDDWPIPLPNRRIFPRPALEKLPHGRYHAGSFDWLVAYAIHLKMQTIALHGIGLNLESGEPISARSCLEYWCGVAEGRGITVRAAPDCDLFAQYHLVKSHSLYGYDDVQLVEDRTQERG